MKKSSKLMRASGVLLVLTLITSCFVGGTFAKYVTEDDTKDTARVAKWGVEVTLANDATSSENATFSENYTKDYSGASIPSEAPGVQLSVSSTEEVVAPGTEGSFGGYDGDEPLPGITLSGRPEVAVMVVTTAEVDLGNNWTDADGQYYCPLVFTIGEETISGMEYADAGIDGFETAIENAIAETTYNPAVTESGSNKTVYPAGTDLKDIGVSYTWEWPFAGLDETDNNGTAGTGHVDQTDEKDTDLANKEWDKVPEITIEVTTTVTQID